MPRRARILKRAPKSDWPLLKSDVTSAASVEKNDEMNVVSDVKIDKTIAAPCWATVTSAATGVMTGVMSAANDVMIDKPIAVIDATIDATIVANDWANFTRDWPHFTLAWLRAATCKAACSIAIIGWPGVMNVVIAEKIDATSAANDVTIDKRIAATCSAIAMTDWRTGKIDVMNAANAGKIDAMIAVIDVTTALPTAWIVMACSAIATTG
jgi:hypothetical protein